MQIPSKSHHSVPQGTLARLKGHDKTPPDFRNQEPSFRHLIHKGVTTTAPRVYQTYREPSQDSFA